MKKIIYVCLGAVIISIASCKKDSTNTVAPDPYPSKRFGGMNTVIDSSEWVKRDSSYTISKNFEPEITTAIKGAKKAEIFGYLVEATIFPMPYGFGKDIEEVQFDSSGGYTIKCYNTDGKLPAYPGKQTYFVEVYIYDK